MIRADRNYVFYLPIIFLLKSRLQLLECDSNHKNGNPNGDNSVVTVKQIWLNHRCLDKDLQPLFGGSLSFREFF